MDTQQVERELAVVLRRRAEVAMSRTDTREEHRTFLSVVDGQPWKRRRRWVVAGAAAAAVVVLVIGVLLWPSVQDHEGSTLPATKVPNATRAANLAAAEGVAAAFAAHDKELLAPFLEPGLSPPASSWEIELKRDAAWGVEYLLEPCQEVTPVWFTCPYQMHLLGSREVGEGPFPNNQIDVNVRDGKVLSAETHKSWETNGIDPYLGSVVAWVEENEAKNSEFLMLAEEQVAAADWPRWTRLWQRAIAKYVAATNAAA